MAINENERQRRLVENTKKRYPIGTRVQLAHMDDPYCPIPSGTRGTIRFIDDIGTVFVDWDNGSTLGLVPGVDSFRKLTQGEIEKEKTAENCNSQTV